MSGRLHILADDLTGALDAAAPFASPERPVLLAAGNAAPSARTTISTESRHLPPDVAAGSVRSAMENLGAPEPASLWFKKVDSVLRGNPVEETKAMFEAGFFARCIFAPAFPEMGRVTRGGLHFTTTPQGRETPAPLHDLVAAFAAAGVRAGDVGDMSAPVWIADAVTQEDLDRLAARHRHGGFILWAGSRGLAAALAGTPARLSHPPVGLVVAGTTHPATRRQMEELSLQAHAQPLIVDPVPLAASAAETATGLLQGLEQAQPALKPGQTIIVIGGDTLSIVLGWAQPHRIACIGEAQPGLPLAKLEGGRLDGMMLLSKSGGFGDALLLSRLTFPKD